MNSWWTLALVVATGSAVWTSSSAEVPTDAPPVALPQMAEENIEPEVRIIETDRGTVYEYSAGGEVYMVRIVPQAGPPYYVVDTDGDGRLDTRYRTPGEINVNQWILYQW